HATGSPVAGVVEPARALAVVVGRALDLADGIDGGPGWERRVYRSLLGSRADDLADALRWYEELEGESLEPSVDLHLAILEGEAGRAERLRGRFDEWTRRGEPFGTFRHLVALAYLSVGSGGADATGLVAQVDAHLEPGWFRDRLVARLTRAEAPNPRAGPRPPPGPPDGLVVAPAAVGARHRRRVRPGPHALRRARAAARRARARGGRAAGRLDGRRRGAGPRDLLALDRVVRPRSGLGRLARRARDARRHGRAHAGLRRAGLPRAPLRHAQARARAGGGRAGQRGRLRRGPRLRRARLRLGLRERGPVGVGVRTHGEPRALDHRARGRQPVRGAHGACGAACLAA